MRKRVREKRLAFIRFAVSHFACAKAPDTCASPVPPFSKCTGAPVAFHVDDKTVLKVKSRSATHYCSMTEGFLAPKHAAFFQRCLQGLPGAYQQLDTTRMTIVFFSISGLDLLERLDVVSPERRAEIVEWIYSQQLTTTSGHPTGRCGWRGWGFGGGAAETGQLALSYSALASLLILGDDLERVDKVGLGATLRASQLPDGSFSAHPDASESDVRFIFCAAVVARVIGDPGAIRVPDAIAFIRSCRNFDGGFGQRPGCESHGGSTFCVLAALTLLGCLGPPALSPAETSRLRRWLMWRQAAGFHGRPNKPDDSCYSFWVGASLTMLGSVEGVDADSARRFTLSCQDAVMGGLGKFSDSFPDALHSYLGLGGLSLLGHPGLGLLEPSLNISVRAASSLPLSPFPSSPQPQSQE